MVFKDPNYKVKAAGASPALAPAMAPAVVEPALEEIERPRARSLSDSRYSPMVMAAKSPFASPSLHPLDEHRQAFSIDEVDFELLPEDALSGSSPGARRGENASSDAPVAQATPGLGRDEPAYVVPTTPSPFLHSAFPPSVVAPFNGYSYMPDMALPPAFGEADVAAHGSTGCGGWQGGCPGMDGISTQMFDPNYGYMQYGWGHGMPMDACGGGYPGGPGMMSGADCSQPPAEGSWGEVLPNGGLAALARAAVAASEEEAPRAKEGSSRRSKRNRGGGGGGKVTAWFGDPPAAVEEKADVHDWTPPSATPAATPKPAAPAAQAAPAAARSAAGGFSAAERAAAAAKLDREGKDDRRQPVGDEIPANLTTVMLRNIPNKYTREMLIKQLSQEFGGQFDFLYLPIDFKNKCNVGYGFINFRTEETYESFVSQFHGVDVRKCLPGLNSKKIVEVTPARVQGKQENVRRLRNSPVMNQLQDHPEWMPLLFNAEGIEEPFPMPDQPLPPVKPRGRNREAAARKDE